MVKELSSHRGRGGYLEALLHGCPDAILAINAEGVIAFANQAACKLTEREMNELVGQSITIVYASPEAARETNRKLYLSGGVIHDHESMGKTKKGKLIPFRISASHLKDSSGNYTGAVGYFQTYRPWTETDAKAKAYTEELEAELEEWKDVGAPVFELYPGLLLVEVVGRLGAPRFERIAGNLMTQVTSVKCSCVLLDLSAALISDSSIASQLIKTIRAIHLLGARCFLAGIQPSTAQDMESLVADVDSIASFSRLDYALEAALNCIGLEIRQRDKIQRDSNLG